MLGCTRRRLTYAIRNGHFASAVKASGQWQLDAGEVKGYTPRSGVVRTLWKAADRYGLTVGEIGRYLLLRMPTTRIANDGVLTYRQALCLAERYGNGAADVNKLSWPPMVRREDTAAAVARKLGLSDSFVSRRLQSGEIKGRKKRGQWRVSQREAKRFTKTLPPEHYSITSAAGAMGRSEHFILHHIRVGNLNAAKSASGKRWYILPEDFNDFQRRLPELIAGNKAHRWYSHKKGARSNASA